MTVDFATFRAIVEILIAALAAVMWFLMRGLISDVRSLAKELDAYKLHVAERYVTQDGLTKALDGIGGQIDAVFRKLERIYEKLDGKADK